VHIYGSAGKKFPSLLTAWIAQVCECTGSSSEDEQQQRDSGSFSW
jgi:hypothetical protein